jgi:hypothetical protein
MIKSACKNILETSAVTLSAGTEDSDYPLYRLYDRNIGRIFKPMAVETIEVLVDQGNEIFADDFDDNSIDPAKWNKADTGTNITETNQRIEGKGNGDWNYNGLVSDNAVALAAGLTWCFTVSPRHLSNAIGRFGPCSRATLSKYASGVYNCLLNFGWYAGNFDVTINNADHSTGYSWQANKTYHIRVVYQSPGWKVYVLSPDDANYSSETLIYSTATDSTGPMYFHANFSSSAGLTYLDDVVAYNASAFEVADRLLIPSGHNLSGETLDLKWSHDGVNYFTAVAQWTGAAGHMNKSWTSNSPRYWKFIVTDPTSAPQLAELFLTSTYEWVRNPARPAGPLDDIFNVEHGQTASGQDRFLVHGDEKRQRVYHLPRCGETQKDNTIALNDAWAGSKPFWLEDHGGNWIYGRLRRPLNLKEVAHQSYSFDFDFLEVLP